MPTFILLLLVLTPILFLALGMSLVLWPRYRGDVRVGLLFILLSGVWLTIL